MKPEDDTSAPSRMAAALWYREKELAPHVTAKGEGRIAEEIVRRAREAGVPIHQSREIAELLVRAPLDRPIPVQLYRLVAEIFAWLYQLEQQSVKTP